MSVRPSRRPALAILAMALVVGVPVSALPGSPPSITRTDSRWTRISTPHFTLYSSARDEVTRSVARNLETMGDALARVHPRFRLSKAAPTRVFIFSSTRDATPYIRLLLRSETTRANGIFVTHAHGGTMIIDASRDRRTSRTAFHELVHEMIANSGWSPPLWLNEGIAEFFGTVETVRHQIRFGQPLPEHIRMLRRRQPISLQKLFEITQDSQQYLAPGHSSLFYAQAWAFTHYLMQRRSPGGGEIYTLLEKLNDGIPTAQALEEVFGIPLSEMEREFRMNVRRMQMPSSKFVVERPLATVDVQLYDCPLPDVLHQLGDLLLSTEHGEDAEAHFAAALELDPQNIRALTGMGQLRSRQSRDPEAESLFRRAIEGAQGDYYPLLIYGERLIRRNLFSPGMLSEGGPEQVAIAREARAMLRQAAALRPGDPRIEGALGTTFVVEQSGSPEGIDLLERSRESLPARSDLTLHLLALYLLDGKDAKAKDLMNRVLLKSADSQVRLAAGATMTRYMVQRANALLKDHKTEEAGAILSALAAEAPPGAARAELERQASELAGLALLNQQIRVYNQAIGLANEGSNESALRMVEELIPSVQDTPLKDDATRLREILRKRAKRSGQ